VPSIQIATYQLTTFRVKHGPPPAGSIGFSYTELTPVAAEQGVSLIVLIYGPSNTMTISGSQLTVYFPREYLRTHSEMLKTESPVFFEWATDPAGVVIGAGLLTGEEFVGEGLIDTS
jgi:hypothetical protein